MKEIKISVPDNVEILDVVIEYQNLKTGFHSREYFNSKEILTAERSGANIKVGLEARRDDKC